MSTMLKRPPQPRRLAAERLVGEKALKEAQALRYKVFSDEFDAQFHTPEAARKNSTSTPLMPTACTLGFAT